MERKLNKTLVAAALGAIPLTLYDYTKLSRKEEDTDTTPDGSFLKGKASSAVPRTWLVPIAPPSSPLTNDPNEQPEDIVPILIGVDSGHGRAGDPGTVSLLSDLNKSDITDPEESGITKLQESDITLGTVKYLEEYFSQDKNYKTLNSRHLDKVGQVGGFAHRPKVVNDAGVKLLISVHVNSAGENSTATGFTCFVVPPPSASYSRLNHQESLRFAKLVAATVKSLGYPLYFPTSTEPGIGYCFYYYDKENQEYKEIVSQDNVANATYRNNRTFYILEDSNCPTVLCEQGFITNPNDVEIFCTDKGQKILAACYYNAVCRYFDTKPVFSKYGTLISEGNKMFRY